MAVHFYAYDFNDSWVAVFGMAEEMQHTQDEALHL